jgi:hypothetical protein
MDALFPYFFIRVKFINLRENVRGQVRGGAGRGLYDTALPTWDLNFI